MAKIERSMRQRIIQAIEDVLNAEIPGTPRISQVRLSKGGSLSGRVMYVALPGSGKKSQNVLSHRAQQVLATINRQRKATSAALQDALEVNRNVIAGAIHELKQAKFVSVQRVPNVSAFESAGEFQPGRVRATAADRKRKTRKKTR